MLGSENSLSQATCEYAPSTPWQATVALVGNSGGVFWIAASMRAVNALSSTSSRS